MPTKVLRHAKDLAHFVPLLPPLGAIVDADAAYGAYSNAFLDRGYHVYAFGYRSVIQPSEKLSLIETSIEETIIPHRTCIGVWAGQTLQTLTTAQAAARLRLFMDWLMPLGFISFWLREGEGVKRLAEQGIAGMTTTTYILYAPQEVEELVVSCGLRTKMAWREGSAEQGTIHVIAQKP